MGLNDYVNPGSAGASAFTDTLHQQMLDNRQAMLDEASRRHQQLMDQYASNEEDRKTAKDAQDSEDRQSKIQATAQAKADTLKQKQLDDFESGVRRDMLPGDVPSPSQVTQAQQVGSSIFRLPQAPVPGPTQTGAPLMQPQMDQPAAYPGTADQRTALANQAHVKDINARLADAEPGTNAYKALVLEYNMIPGNKALAPGWGDGVKPTAPDIPVMRTNPRTGQVEQIGTAPAASHFVSEPPPPQASFTAQDRHNADGTIDSGILNTHTGEFKVIPGMGTVHAAPGAAALATKAAAKADARKTLDALDQDIDEADSKGLIGPAAGRAANMAAWLGNPDPATSTLATRMQMAKMQVDAGVGGMRAASSPTLLKLFDNTMSSKMTKENLHATVRVMRQLVSDNVAPATGTPSAADLIKKYSQ